MNLLDSQPNDGSVSRRKASNYEIDGFQKNKAIKSTYALLGYSPSINAENKNIPFIFA